LAVAGTIRAGGFGAQQQGGASGVCQTGADEIAVAGAIRKANGGERRTGDLNSAAYQCIRPPSLRVVLLENHGLITLGGTAEAVLAAMLMAEKTAQIWRDAAALGGPAFLSSNKSRALPDVRMKPGGGKH
jgi:ribulose-5-phosphate 4-epimerase/fuculose-1-phosphate aldolase